MSRTIDFTQRVRAGLAAFIFVLIAVATAAHGQTAAPADRFAAISPRMQQFVDQGLISGIVSLVADRQHILYAGAVGKSDLSTGRAMQTDDIFWIASMSKPITAVCAAMLVDDGKLKWDDPVETYLPEFRNQWLLQQQTATQRTLVHPTHKVTVRDLVTHTSGLGEYPVTQPHWTLAQMTMIMAREPLRFEPTTRWAYSTAGLDSVGRVVEAVSGMPYAQFMQQRLLDPLDMKDTTFWISPEQLPRYAHTYRLNAQTNKLDETPIDYMYHGEITDHQRPALGGAGLFSTARDVSRFYQMMLNQGTLDGHQILKPETVTEMTKVQTGTLTARAGMPWGLGFCVVQDPKAMEANVMLTPYSFGHGGAFGTNSWADPTRGIVYVMMLERDKMGNPDNSPMHIAFQTLASDAMGK